MVVDFIFQPRISCRIRAWLSLQNDRATIRHDQPSPNQQDTRLAERDLAVVDADQARSLRRESGLSFAKSYESGPNPLVVTNIPRLAPSLTTVP